MRIKQICFGTLLAISGLPSLAAAAAEKRELLPQSIADVVDSVRPSVVNIHVKGIVAPGPGQVSFKEPRMTDFVGSGVIVDESGIIFTNNHVVDNAYELRVLLADGTLVPARLLGKGRQLDIALIKIDVGHPLPVGKVGDSDEVRVGDRVFAMGNPLGLSGTVTSGIVSAVNREVNGAPYNYIQTDAPVNHGNSGGPLFNMRGEVIGINQQIFSDTKGGGSIGLGFAMPVNDLKFITYQIRDHGRPRIGSVGLRVQALTPNMAGALQLPDASGAIVSEVVPASPAEAAGIKVGDVIMTYDDTKLANHRQFIRVVGEYTIGKKIVLGLWSAGASKTASVQVRELPQELWEDYNSKTVQAPRFTQISDFGMELVEMSPELRKQFDIGAKFNGPVVKEVVTEGAAENANLSAGDVVQKVGLNDVASVADFTRLITEARDRGGRDVLVLIGNSRGSWWTTLPLQL
ncbi:MAG TPA: trypsin-like peptidase domain-containing protein [Beijerinckiaceae bacterium]|nr:trypsin-like peptidase domain-containing protein [Beijerinckiaceae bacterium]